MDDFDAMAEARKLVHRIRAFRCGALAGPKNEQHWDICDDDTATVMAVLLTAFEAGAASRAGGAVNPLLERARDLMANSYMHGLLTERALWLADYRAASLVKGTGGATWSPEPGSLGSCPTCGADSIVPEAPDRQEQGQGACPGPTHCMASFIGGGCSNEKHCDCCPSGGRTTGRTEP